MGGKTEGRRDGNRENDTLVKDPWRQHIPLTIPHQPLPPAHPFHSHLMPVPHQMNHTISASFMWATTPLQKPIMVSEQAFLGSPLVMILLYKDTLNECCYPFTSTVVAVCVIHVSPSCGFWGYRAIRKFQKLYEVTSRLVFSDNKK